MRIFVDSDLCPVKEEIINISQNMQINSFLVSTYCQFHLVNEKRLFHHRIATNNDRLGVIEYIINEICANDIVITSHYDLAKLALDKKAQIITYRGRIISDKNIEFLQHMKNIYNKSQVINSRFSCLPLMDQEDRKLFHYKLEELINKIVKLQLKKDLLD